jgi:hypothetical protein
MLACANAFAVTGTVTDVYTSTTGYLYFHYSGSAVTYIVSIDHDPNGLYDLNTQGVFNAYTGSLALGINTVDCDSSGGSSWCFVSTVNF